jgi:preprotein translocase subunit SecE
MGNKSLGFWFDVVKILSQVLWSNGKATIT